MKLSFRLMQVLEQYRDCDRGVINRIVESTKLKRHQVSAILHNRVQYVSLDALGAICGYLVKTHRLDPQQLPGLLFARETVGFWGLLTQRRQLDICLGYRVNKDLEQGWVTDADTFLQGELVYGVTSQGAGDPNLSLPVKHFYQQSLVPAPGKAVELAVAHRKARHVYEVFVDNPTDAALIACGSMKINLVVDLILAHAFGAQPFEAEKDPQTPADRKCPFMFRYRADDPRIRSCAGGMRLSHSSKSPLPGIYFEEEDGHWTCCPWDGGHDAALVFFRYQPNHEKVEMILGGFSSRSTRNVAYLLRTHAKEFWPACYVSPDQEIGAYIVTFQFKEGNQGNLATFDSYHVHKLDASVIKRRMVQLGRHVDSPLPTSSKAASGVAAKEPDAKPTARKAAAR